MATIARVDDVQWTEEDLIRFLKINNRFDQIIEDMVTEHLTTVEAKKMGLTVGDDEVQQESDQVRRALGLHRAQDTLDLLDGMGLSIDGFEQVLRGSLLRRKALEVICSEQRVQEHFELHSPKYETVEIARIVVDSKGKAQEVIALLEEEPEAFGDLAMQLSLDSETAERGGYIGKFSRGELKNEMEAKIFNGREGEILGPFEVEEGRLFEIYLVKARHAPAMDLATKKTIAKQIYEGWLDARLQEHRIEIL